MNCCFAQFHTACTNHYNRNEERRDGNSHNIPIKFRHRAYDVNAASEFPLNPNIQY
jgi:hypothetical protein